MDFLCECGGGTPMGTQSRIQWYSYREKKEELLLSLYGWKGETMKKKSSFSSGFLLHSDRDYIVRNMASFTVKMRRYMIALILTDDQVPNSVIAEFVDRCPDTVRRWAKKYRYDGLHAFFPDR